MFWEWLDFKVIWLGIVGAVVLYGFRPVQRWKFRHIPGPPPVWLVGNLLELEAKGRVNAMRGWGRQHGPVYKYFQGGTMFVVVADAAAARAVHLRNHARPPVLSFFTEGTEGARDMKSLAVTEGPLWQALRQAWQTVFLPDSVRGYVDLINSSADHLLEAFAKAEKTGVVQDIWRLAGCYTLEVVGSAALGMDLDTFRDDALPFGADASKIVLDDSDDMGSTTVKTVAVFFDIGCLRRSAYIVVDMLFPELAPLLRRAAYLFPDDALGRFLKGKHKMRISSLERIEAAKQNYRSQLDSRSRGAEEASALDKQGVEGAKSPLTRRRGKGVAPGTFVQALLQAANLPIGGRKFTDEEISTQMFTVMVTGAETTASAITFTLYHVAANSAAEEKVLREVDDFGRNSRFGYDDLGKFPYLTACFNEALRLDPPLGLGTVRMNREDTTICGYRIPKGAWLNMSQQYYQRDPQHWEDPDEFRPERLLPLGATASPAWTPFGDGSRSCVGLKLAYAEGLIALVRLYQRFTFQLVPGQLPLKTEAYISHRPQAGVNVTVCRRA